MTCHAVAVGYSFGWILMGFLINALYLPIGADHHPSFSWRTWWKTWIPQPEDGVIANGFGPLQLQTTSNFARKNKILSWYVGGLNYQITPSVS